MPLKKRASGPAKKNKTSGVELSAESLHGVTGAGGLDEPEDGGGRAEEDVGEELPDAGEDPASEQPASAAPEPASASSRVVADEVGSVKVCVRMRPLASSLQGAAGSVSAASEPSTAVVLPLHQRLRIIKARRGGCSTADAGRALMRDAGRAEEARRSPWADSRLPEPRESAREDPSLRDVTNDDRGAAVVRRVEGS